MKVSQILPALWSYFFGEAAPPPTYAPVARPGASRYATQIEGPMSAVLMGSRHTTAKV